MCVHMRGGVTRVMALAGANAAEACVKAADTAYTLGGGTSIFEHSPLQRCLRDAHVVTQHIMVAPPPANQYPTEFDFSTYSQPLVNLTDVDPLQYPFTDAIPFLAAHFAKLGAQRFDEADAFLKVFDQRLNRVRARRNQ